MYAGKNATCIRPPTKRTQSTPSMPRADLSRLQATLDATWSDHAVAGTNIVSVVDASAGSWEPRAGCSTPSLLIFLVGHYRTFSWTQHHFAAVAEASGCAFIAAFMPEEVDASVDATTPGALGRVDPRLTRELQHLHPAGHNNSIAPTSVSALLRHASAHTFSRGVGFAYATVQRVGAVARYPACLSLYWQGVFALMQWSARAHALKLDDTAVIIRTRPDVLLTRPVIYAPLRAYFANGTHGRHMALGQYVKRASGSHSNEAQSDVHCVFSLSSYELDVARPFELAADRTLPHAPLSNKLWWQRGWANGWCMGRSSDDTYALYTNATDRYACPLVSCADGHAHSWIQHGAHHTIRHEEHTPIGGMQAPQARERMQVPQASSAGSWAPPAWWLFTPRNVTDGTRPPAPTMMQRCIDSCLCPDGGVRCRRPSCLLSIAEGPVVKTASCPTRGTYFERNGTTESNASGMPPGPSCVLRGPLVQAPSQRWPLLGSAIDMSETVHCYCAVSTTPATVAKKLGLLCNTHISKSCAQIVTTVVLPSQKPPVGGFWRCARGVPLVAEGGSKAGDGASGTLRAHASERGGHAVHSPHVWPAGCALHNPGESARIVPMSTCLGLAARDL